MTHQQPRIRLRQLVATGTVLWACAVLSACGSSRTPPPAAPPVVTPITGVSLPNSISVVTATNAG